MLDTKLTFTSICNKDLLAGVKIADEPIEMKTNVGTQMLIHTGEILGMKQKVWYDPKSVASIFGFGDMVYQYCITYDSEKEDTFNIHVSNNKVVKFKCSSDGLYYYNLPEEYRDSV